MDSTVALIDSHAINCHLVYYYDCRNAGLKRTRAQLSYTWAVNAASSGCIYL